MLLFSEETEPNPWFCCYWARYFSAELCSSEWDCYKVDSVLTSIVASSPSFSFLSWSRFCDVLLDYLRISLDFLFLFIVTSCKVKIAERGRSSPKKCTKKIIIPYSLVQFAQLLHCIYDINSLLSANSIMSKMILMMKL